LQDTFLLAIHRE